MAGNNGLPVEPFRDIILQLHALTDNPMSLTITGNVTVGATLKQESYSSFTATLSYSTSSSGNASYPNMTVTLRPITPSIYKGCTITYLSILKYPDFNDGVNYGYTLSVGTTGVNLGSTFRLKVNGTNIPTYAWAYINNGVYVEMQGYNEGGYLKSFYNALYNAYVKGESVTVEILAP